MTAKTFQKTIDPLLASNPFLEFNIELRGGTLFHVRDLQELQRKGARIFTDSDGRNHYFDHESVVGIFASPELVKAKKTPRKTNYASEYCAT